MALEMLGDLVHKGPYGGFPAWLKAAVIGRIQIGDPSAVHDRLYDGGGRHTRHAGKGINIDHAIVAFFNKLKDGGDAQTGFRGNIKRKNIFFPEQLLQMPLDFRFSIGGWVLWLVIVAVLSALASLWPALRATQVSVRESLAYE